MKAIIFIASICLAGCDGAPIAKCVEGVVYYKPYAGANYYRKTDTACLPTTQPQEAAR